MAKSRMQEDNCSATIPLTSLYPALELSDDSELESVFRLLPPGTSVERNAESVTIRVALNRDDVMEVALYWRSKTKRDSRTELTQKRLSTIRARLRSGWSVVDCKKAVDACCQSAWHNGDNPSGVKYNDVQHIFSPEQIEKWVSAKTTQQAVEQDAAQQTLLRRRSDRNGR
jgi:uncharacterized phage protein (TIGR02220 family)